MRVFCLLAMLDAQVRLDDVGIGAHVSGRSITDAPAVVEHDDMVGNLHDDAHIVLDQQDRCTLGVADVMQQPVECRALLGVQARRRFVEAQQDGIGAHGARDLKAALIAIGQFAGRIVGAIREGDLI